MLFVKACILCLLQFSASSLRISSPVPEHVVDFNNERYKSVTESPKGFSGKPGRPTFYQLHIPKTGGSALTTTLQEQGDWLKGAGVVALESCYDDMNQRVNSSKGDGVITFLREPVMHVYSQYYQACFHRSCGVSKNIHSYIDYFDEVRDARNVKPCYSAFNMQTRALTCSGGSHQVLADWGPSGKRLEEAKQNVKNTYFTGILELFQESLCVFYVKQHGELPMWCNCEDKAAWSSHEPSHYDKYHAPSHQLSDLTPTDLEKIQHFISDDAELYAFAKARFLTEIKDIEEKFKTTVMCKK